MRRRLLPDLGGGGSSRISAMAKAVAAGRPEDQPGNRSRGALSNLRAICLFFSLVNFRRLFFAG